MAFKPLFTITTWEIWAPLAQYLILPFQIQSCHLKARSAALNTQIHFGCATYLLYEGMQPFWAIHALGFYCCYFLYPSTNLCVPTLFISTFTPRSLMKTLNKMRLCTDFSESSLKPFADNSPLTHTFSGLSFSFLSTHLISILLLFHSVNFLSEHHEI